MKKFTTLGNNNKTTVTSDNRVDFITNLINESLTVENDKIVGMDTLSIAINKILDINESKTTIKVLENIKLLSTRTLNLQIINEAIDSEKIKISNLKSDVVVEEPVKLELISESVKHEDTKCKDGECEDSECEDGKCKDVESEDGEKTGEGEEDDDKIEKTKKVKENSDFIYESKGNHIYITDGEVEGSELNDLSKLYKSIKDSSKEETKE